MKVWITNFDKAHAGQNVDEMQKTAFELCSFIKEQNGVEDVSVAIMPNTDVLSSGNMGALLTIQCNGNCIPGDLVIAASKRFGDLIFEIHEAD